MKNEWYMNKLESMRERYQMFIGDGNVTHLKAFLDGYMECRSDSGLDRLSVSESDFIQAFTYWVAIKAEESATNGWADIILSKLSDEQNSVESFYCLLGEFKESWSNTSLSELKANYNAMVQDF